MKKQLPIIFLSVCIGMLLSIASAQAQIGDGWKEYFPGKDIQLRGPGTTYTNVGGIETFTMKSGDERSEVRIQDTYSSGQHQWEGSVRCSEGQGTCVHQVFKFVMVVYCPTRGGELRQHSMTPMIENIKDTWVRINTIHDVSAGKCDVYVNGVLKATVKQGRGPWYNKYGLYNCSTNGARCEWKDIRYWSKDATNSAPERKVESRGVDS